MNQTRFIAGSGRSGTTWILDTLAAANSLRPVFEPLNPYASAIGRTYAHRVLLPGEEHPELRTFLEDVFAGREIRLWSKYRRLRHWLVPMRAAVRTGFDASRLARRWGRFLREAPGLAVRASHREPLVKCIWSNLMLGWLAEDCNCRILFVVRHPGAVIESELRSGWRADETLDRFKRDPKLRELGGGRYWPMLREPLEPVESLALRWLIENQPVVDGECSGVEGVVHYEELVSMSPLAWGRVRDVLSLERIPGAKMLARPSQQSWPAGSASIQNRSAGSQWMPGLTPDQSGKIQRLLDRCSFDLYSMLSPNPSRAGARTDARKAGGAV